MSLTHCVVLRFECTFFAFPAENDEYEILQYGSPRYQEKRGFPWIKIAQIFFYSLNRSKSFLVVVQNLIWEDGGKPCWLKVGRFGRLPC